MKDSSNSSTGENGNTSHSPPARAHPKKQCSPAKHWLFTFNNPLEGNEMKVDPVVPIVPVFESLFRSGKLKRYVMQLEKGEKCGTIHLQGYIEMTSKGRPSSLMLPAAIHFESCRNVEAAILYCRKDETALGYSWENGFPKPIKTLMPEQFYEWQKDGMEMINNSNDREILWFWDEIGCVGKSAFCKYLCVHHKAIILGGKGVDMKHGVSEFVKKNGDYPELIIMDIPRSCADYVSYGGIEEIKNGCFFSSKFDSGMVLGNCPTVVCFSNQPPEYEKMSRDRWTVKCIDQEMRFLSE